MTGPVWGTGFGLVLGRYHRRNARPRHLRVAPAGTGPRQAASADRSSAGARDGNHCRSLGGGRTGSGVPGHREPHGAGYRKWRRDSSGDTRAPSQRAHCHRRGRDRHRAEAGGQPRRCARLAGACVPHLGRTAHSPRPPFHRRRLEFATGEARWNAAASAGAIPRAHRLVGVECDCVACCGSEPAGNAGGRRRRRSGLDTGDHRLPHGDVPGAVATAQANLRADANSTRSPSTIRRLGRRDGPTHSRIAHLRTARNRPKLTSMRWSSTISAHSGAPTSS